MKSMALFMILTAMMNAGQISTLLSNRAKNNASPQALWTIGFEYYYQHGFSPKEMARVLAKAYAGARGQTPEQNAILKQAAAFWEKELAYWPESVIPAKAWRERLRPYRPFIRGFQAEPLPMLSAPQ